MAQHLMHRVPIIFVGLVLTIVATEAPLQAQQQADPSFKPKVATPTYSKKRPKVMFDEGHANFHTAAERYKPFIDLIRADGCLVSVNKSRLRED